MLQVDGYAGFERLTAPGDIVLAACWVLLGRHAQPPSSARQHTPQNDAGIVALACGMALLALKIIRRNTS